MPFWIYEGKITPDDNGSRISAHLRHSSRRNRKARSCGRNCVFTVFLLIALKE
jgi:hypothetical protein